VRGGVRFLRFLNGPMACVVDKNEVAGEFDELIEPGNSFMCKDIPYQSGMIGECPSCFGFCGKFVLKFIIINFIFIIIIIIIFFAAAVLVVEGLVAVGGLVYLVLSKRRQSIDFVRGFVRPRRMSEDIELQEMGPLVSPLPGPSRPAPLETNSPQSPPKRPPRKKREPTPIDLAVAALGSPPNRRRFPSGARLPPVPPRLRRSAVGKFNFSF